MGPDIRIPIGLLFLSIGLILVAEGMVSDPRIYIRSDNINVNLYWGLILLAFGLLMAGFGISATAAARTASTRADGRNMQSTAGFFEEP